MLKLLLAFLCFSFSSIAAQANSTDQITSEDAILNYVTRYFPKEVRTIDGKGNNKKSPEAGTPLSLLERLTYADYEDGVGSPAPRTKNPREISVNFFQYDDTRNYKKASDYLWLWGQFMDHDITLSDINKEELMNIHVPACDRFFDISCTGTNEMIFPRSEHVMIDGVREHFNRVTSYIDGSMVYGSDEERTNTLRAHDGLGRMILDEQGYLPKNTFGLPNLPSDIPHFFVAGDIRVNDHIGLMAMHNLFVREHNYWALQIHIKKPELTDEEIFQRARAIVIAEIQNITFNEFLPMLVGGFAPGVDAQYDSRKKAAIFTEFSTAAFRMGHTFVSGELYLENMNGEGSVVALKDSFFNPHEYQRGGMDSILLGFSKHMAQERDPMINESLQNFLLVFPEDGFFDLFSFNVQRGRDHGIPSYNELRRSQGLKKLTDFSQITSSGAFNRALSDSYDNVDQIDPWLGLIAEKSSKDSLLGTTASKIISHQFKHLRDSDRLWFTRTYAGSFVDAIKGQTLTDILIRNTNVTEANLNGTDVFKVY